MIERVLEQERAISQVLKADKKSRHLDFTDASSGEKYVSVSYLKPVPSLFNSSILAEEETDTQLTKDVKGNILAYLNDKYSDQVTDDLLDLASLLDPRFRTKYMEKEKVEQVLSRAVEEIMALTRAQDTLSGLLVVQKELQKQSIGKNKKDTGQLFQKTEEQQQQQLTVRRGHKKGAVYLQTTEVESDADPLDWWRCHQTNFPRIAKLARQYLCIPATSAPSERTFSTGGNIVTCHRAALKPDAVDRLVFLEFINVLKC
ncbi:Zinc finger BED domain-containing protein 1 [Merluccius polli]|uniref:Zinc finger BED domain-containing protein 1 n=1 Tax=Merluccius polli TaxID=89951 RepID=A0AA47MQ06_MERPO|nr:Zinc finger BED domain-containing protein 1 [Merluccius polli]